MNKPELALADFIRDHNRMAEEQPLTGFKAFDETHLRTLGDFCAQQSPRFCRKSWLDYIVAWKVRSL